MFDPEEDDMDEIDGDFERINQTLDATVENLDQSRYVEIRELAGSGIDVGMGGQIAVGEVIAFVILKYTEGKDASWTVPSPGLFRDLIHRISGQCFDQNLLCQRAFRWASLWGRVGLLGLGSRNLDDIKAYRELVESQVTGGTRFTFFPKEALERRGNLSVLLRENYYSFKTEWLPKAILLRSRMKGGLRLTHVKRYRPDDRTRDGISKEGWRLVLLQGCPQFMEELKRYDQDHRFPVGAGHIVIRGGNGRPKGTTTRGRRTGGEGGRPQDQQYHHQQQQQHRQQHQRQSYDQEGPMPRRDRDRERERYTGGHGGARGHLSSTSAAWGNAGPRRGPR